MSNENQNLTNRLLRPKHAHLSSYNPLVSLNNLRTNETSPGFHTNLCLLFEIALSDQELLQPLHFPLHSTNFISPSCQDINISPLYRPLDLREQHNNMYIPPLSAQMSPLSIAPQSGHSIDLNKRAFVLSDPAYSSSFPFEFQTFFDTSVSSSPNPWPDQIHNSFSLSPLKVEDTTFLWDQPRFVSSTHMISPIITPIPPFTLEPADLSPFSLYPSNQFEINSTIPSLIPSQIWNAQDHMNTCSSTIFSTLSLDQTQPTLLNSEYPTDSTSKQIFQHISTIYPILTSSTTMTATTTTVETTTKTTIEATTKPVILSASTYGSRALRQHRSNKVKRRIRGLQNLGKAIAQNHVPPVDVGSHDGSHDINSNKDDRIQCQKESNYGSQTKHG